MNAEAIATMVSLMPFADSDPLRVVELGAGEVSLTAAVLTRFSRASVSLLEPNDAVREGAAQTLMPFRDRVRVVAADLSALDWWDRMFGADLVVSAMQVNGLNDTRKQYLYKAAGDRLSPRGGLLIADRLDPGRLLHHLIWLRHAGFAEVDCYWRQDELAIFGGFRPAGASAPRPPAGN